MSTMPKWRSTLLALCAAASALTGCVATTPSPTSLPRSDDPVTLDPADFTTEIDNTYWPMEPGTRWTYRELDPDGVESTVDVTVTDATKTIANGIEARVVRDTVRQDGEIIEDTFDWYAQDAAGAIWYLGEDTAEFEDGEIVSREDRSRRVSMGRCRASRCRPTRSPAWSIGRSTPPARPRTTAPC